MKNAFNWQSQASRERKNRNPWWMRLASMDSLIDFDGTGPENIYPNKHNVKRIGERGLHPRNQQALSTWLKLFQSG